MSLFYVYIHRDPLTREVVYIGKGKYGRAWDVTRCRGQNKGHQLWMMELADLGYTPNDWVEILCKNLTEKEAFQKEAELLRGALYQFNNSGEKQHQAKMTNEQALEAFRLAKGGMMHKDIAIKFNVSRSAISMLASGKQWKSVTAKERNESITI